MSVFGASSQICKGLPTFRQNSASPGGFDSIMTHNGCINRRTRRNKEVGNPEQLFFNCAIKRGIHSNWSIGEKTRFLEILLCFYTSLMRCTPVKNLKVLKLQTYCQHMLGMHGSFHSFLLPAFMARISKQAISLYKALKRTTSYILSWEEN